MKRLTRYISLLFICGFMFPFHYNYTYIIDSNRKLPAYLAKSQRIKATLQPELRGEGFSFFEDVIANIAPALKNLN